LTPKIGGRVGHEKAHHEREEMDVADREGCSECGSAARGPDGLCKPCRIEKEEGPEAKARYYSRIGRRGGHAVAKKREPEGLDPDELPDLRTRQDAMIWLEVIGRAGATGRLTARDARDLSRVVKTWLEAAGEHEVAETLEEVLERLQQVEKDQKGPKMQAVP
jgi:hypothetical protein